MEGMLWKWTNYFSGWQPRWFVLDNSGVLSYYKSKDDVSNGSKGSLKVSACEVSVHHADASRIDLIIPGEAHFYLRAATPQDRQKWVVALGSAKACVTNDIVTSHSAPTSKLPEDALKVKKSELRLYCDLLMQQVHGVKCATEVKDNPNVELLNESTSLLSATCDTFIQTLDDCIKLAHAKVDATLTESHSHISSASSLQRTLSVDRHIPSSKNSTLGHFKSASPSLSDTYDVSPTKASIPSTPTTPHSNCGAVFFERNGSSNSEVEDDVRIAKRLEVSTTHLPTFFTDLAVSFLDVRLTNDSDIPTVPFLDACRSGLQFFDRFSQTAFAPAKLDIAANIRKIHQKYVSNPEAFDTLKKMLVFELNAGQSKQTSSATLSLLWLNRSLQFVNEFITAFLAAGAEEDLTNSINTAYAKSLSDYHGWVVRGAFAGHRLFMEESPERLCRYTVMLPVDGQQLQLNVMAFKLAPTRTELINNLASNASHIHHPSFTQSVLRDMGDYSAALTVHTKLLHTFFVDNDLNFPDQV